MEATEYTYKIAYIGKGFCQHLFDDRAGRTYCGKVPSRVVVETTANNIAYRNYGTCVSCKKPRR